MRNLVTCGFRQPKSPRMCRTDEGGPGIRGFHPQESDAFENQLLHIPREGQWERSFLWGKGKPQKLAAGQSLFVMVGVTLTTLVSFLPASAVPMDNTRNPDNLSKSTWLLPALPVRAFLFGKRLFRPSSPGCRWEGLGVVWTSGFQMVRVLQNELKIPLKNARAGSYPCLFRNLG